MAILHVNILVDGCKFTVPEWCVLIDIDFIVIVSDKIFATVTSNKISASDREKIVVHIASVVVERSIIKNK